MLLCRPQPSTTLRQPSLKTAAWRWQVRERLRVFEVIPPCSTFIRINSRPPGSLVTLALSGAWHHILPVRWSHLICFRAERDPTTPCPVWREYRPIGVGPQRSTGPLTFSLVTMQNAERGPLIKRDHSLPPVKMQCCFTWVYYRSRKVAVLLSWCFKAIGVSN